jgi:hypothetical protein
MNNPPLRSTIHGWLPFPPGVLHSIHQIEKEKEKKMSNNTNLFVSIQKDILAGVLMLSEIAEKHEVPVSWVAEVYVEMKEQEAMW